MRKCIRNFQDFEYISAIFKILTQMLVIFLKKNAKRSRKSKMLKCIRNCQNFEYISAILKILTRMPKDHESQKCSNVSEIFRISSTFQQFSKFWPICGVFFKECQKVTKVKNAQIYPKFSEFWGTFSNFQNFDPNVGQKVKK